jgi:hypothetical protein
LILVITTLILKKITDSQKGTRLIVIWHFKQVVTRLNTIYKHKKILVTLSMIWICLKNKPNSHVPNYTKILKHVTFAITKLNSKNFSLKKTIWYFVMMFALLQTLMYINTIHMSGVCLLFKSYLYCYIMGINSHLYP